MSLSFRVVITGKFFLKLYLIFALSVNQQVSLFLKSVLAYKQLSLIGLYWHCQAIVINIHDYKASLTRRKNFAKVISESF